MATYLERHIIGIEMIKLSNSFSSYLRLWEKTDNGKSSMDYCFNSEPLSVPKTDSEIEVLKTQGWKEGSIEAYEALRLQVVKRMKAIEEVITQ